MFNNQSITAVNESEFLLEFRRPLYNSYSFKNIAPTIKYLLGAERFLRSNEVILPENTFTYNGKQKFFKKLIFIFIDGMGWNLLERMNFKHPLLRTIATEGIISKLTAIFPSTTANCVTTYTTGKMAIESGVCGWYYYEPLVKKIISPLPYRDYEGNDLSVDHVNLITKIIPQGRLHPDLQQEGITTYYYGSENYTPSRYSDRVHQANYTRPFGKLTDAFDQLMKDLQSGGKSFHSVYIDEVDNVSHDFGPLSDAVMDRLPTIFALLEKLLQNIPPETAVMVSADHGQSSNDPTKTVYINEVVQDIEDFLILDQEGRPLVPTDTNRDFFLYAKPETASILRAKLQQALADIAYVHTRDELLAENIYGNQPPTAEFLERMGNIVIIPRAGQTVWWKKDYIRPRLKMGSHGGMSPDEMEIPLLFYPN